MAKLKNCEECCLYNYINCFGKLGTDGNHIFDCKNCTHGSYNFADNSYYCDCNCETEFQCGKRFKEGIK